jgi:hypothetical protein
MRSVPLLALAVAIPLLGGCGKSPEQIASTGIIVRSFDCPVVTQFSEPTADGSRWMITRPATRAQVMSMPQYHPSSVTGWERSIG